MYNMRSDLFKKNSLRMLCILCAGALSSGIIGCSGDPPPSPPQQPQGEQLVLERTSVGETFKLDPVSYSLSTKSVASGIFSISDGSIHRKGNGATLNKSTVSALQLNKLLQGTDEKTVIEADLQVEGLAEQGGHETLYLGLRLEDPAKQATASKGVWLALRGKQVGMRKGKWPATAFVDSKVDFSTKRHLYIEDDPSADIITLFADDDNGVKTEIFRVQIDGSMLNGFLPGETEPVLQNQLEDDVPKNGYFKFWLHHHRYKAVIENLKITGYEAKLTSSTVADPLFLRDVFSDTWVATDDEGRVSAQNTDKNISSKQVGMFYFLAMQGSGTYFDHTATYYGDDNGENGVKRLTSLLHREGSHYWAQPYFGYYRSADEWVIRKHAYMLNDAGVDFIYLDITNGVTYTSTYETIFRVFSKMRQEGYNTPKIAFHCGYLNNNITKSLPEIYLNIYSQERFRDLWFEWEGKPLVLAENDVVENMSDEIKELFTFRSSWAHSDADWYTDTEGKGCWPWADMFPQNPGYSLNGELEQMVVMSGYWANSISGRSFSNGRQPSNSEFSFQLTTDGTSGKGIAYQEQFGKALQTDPPLIMLVGWNEWSAGRHSTDALKNDGQLIAGTYVVDSKHGSYRYSYIDCFSPEYSRDIEPVSGIFKDNYYYQTVMNVRNYKGTRGIAGAFGQKTIDITADASQWLSVGPEYRDYQGDITHRDHASTVIDLRYTNDTGRNDFVVSKVSADSENVYFYAECASDITAAEGTNWMNLFIDSDCNAATGWYGYDYIINRSQNGNKASVEAFATTAKNAEWSVSSAGEAEFTVSAGKTIVIKLPKSVVALGDTFDFKWADNSIADGKEILQFLDLGDTAPNGRFNYRYTTTDTTINAPSCLTEDMTVFKANSYNAYANGKQVMLDSSSTKIVAVGEKGTIYLPKSFVINTMGISEDSLPDPYVYENAYYVAINDAVTAMGKKITVSNEGLIVVSSSVIEDTDTLDTLYRALM